MMFQNLIGGLASLEASEKKDAISNFECGCILAKKLGAKFITITSPWPETISAHTATLPEYFYLNVPDMFVPGMENRSVDGWQFEVEFHMDLPDKFVWKDYWNNFRDSLERINAIASKNDIRLTVENRNNTMLEHTDSMMRMIRNMDDNIGADFNVSQSFLQRECLEWAVHKYGKKLYSIHACDGDGLACYNLPVGDGTIDWEGIIYALKEIGYDGYITFDWLNDSRKDEHVQKSLQYIRDLIHS